MRVMLIAAAVAAVGVPAAYAQGGDGASLTLAAAGPTAVIQDGAHWRCEGTSCKATRVKGLPALHACKRLVGELGAVTAFTWRGQTLSAEQLAACNAAVKG